MEEELQILHILPNEGPSNTIPMHSLLSFLVLASWSLSTGFRTSSFSLRSLTTTRIAATADENPLDTKTVMTTTEKEKDFQNTLDNLLIEARANNAAAGKEEGAEFSIEEMRIASEEMKKLKESNSGTSSVVTQSAEDKLKARLTSYGDDKEIAQPTNTEGGGFGKKIAIFGALTLVFSAALLPIIDKIFPDPPSIQNSISSK